MITDIDGNPLGPSVWHGCLDEGPPLVLLSAAEKGSWWKPMNQEQFLNPCFDDRNVDQRLELDHELRTAYPNIVYDAFQHSGDTELSDLAQRTGIDGLGAEISILFVTENERYAERYGAVHEIDLAAEGLIAVIPDENINRGFGCWLLVFKAGSPFPIKRNLELSEGPSI